MNEYVDSKTFYKWYNSFGGLSIIHYNARSLNKTLLQMFFNNISSLKPLIIMPTHFFSQTF